jgi:hypothetical protein
MTCIDARLAARSGRRLAATQAGTSNGVERGSNRHGPRQDDALKAELSGQLGSSGGHREEWTDPEPPADDDPDLRQDRVQDRAMADAGAWESAAGGTGQIPRTGGGGSASGPVDPE